jgi:hypothetical protein
MGQRLRGPGGHRKRPAENIAELYHGRESRLPTNVKTLRGRDKKFAGGVKNYSPEVKLFEGNQCREVYVIIGILRRMVQIRDMYDRDSARRTGPTGTDRPLPGRRGQTRERGRSCDQEISTTHRSALLL